MAGKALGIAEGGTSQTTAAGARVALGLNIGSDIQPWDADLDALAGLTTAGIIVRTGDGTAATRTITGTADRVTITNGDGVAGNPTVDIAATYVGQNTITTLGTITTGVWNGTDIAVADGGTGVSTITGLVSGNGTSAFVGRTITGTVAEITVTNGSGATANPTISLPTALTFTGKTVTGGTFNSGAFNGTVGATTPSTGAFTSITSSGAVDLTGTTTIISTDAGAGIGPQLLLYRNSASPAAADAIGQIQFQGKDSTGNTTAYVDMFTTIADPTNGSEDGTLTIRNIVAGITTIQATVSATGWNNMNIGATTPGTGSFTTLNSTGGALNGTLGATTPSTIVVSNGSAGSPSINSSAGTGMFFSATGMSVSSGGTTHSLFNNTGFNSTRNGAANVSALIRSDNHGSGVNVAQLSFTGQNSTPAAAAYSIITSTAVSNTAGAHEGRLTFSNAVAGVSTTALTLSGTAATIAGSLTVGGGTTLSTISIGTWTPTLTNLANIDASTANICHYMRVGTMVTCWGAVLIDPTAAANTLTRIALTLPIASNLAAATDLSGTITAEGIQRAGVIQPDVLNDRAEVRFYSEVTANTTFRFTFGYTII